MIENGFWEDAKATKKDSIMSLLKRINRVKKYAELHGNMQRYRIKSLYDNKIERGNSR